MSISERFPTSVTDSVIPSILKESGITSVRGFTRALIQEGMYGMREVVEEFSEYQRWNTIQRERRQEQVGSSFHKRIYLEFGGALLGKRLQLQEEIFGYDNFAYRDFVNFISHVFRNSHLSMNVIDPFPQIDTVDLGEEYKSVTRGNRLCTTAQRTRFALGEHIKKTILSDKSLVKLARRTTLFSEEVRRFYNRNKFSESEEAALPVYEKYAPVVLKLQTNQNE